MAALTRAITGEEPNSPRRKRPINADARGNSTEDPTLLEEMGQISGEPTTPEDSRENTNEENAGDAVECHQSPCHRPLAGYVKLWVAHAPGMPGTFSPVPRVSNPDMHHGTCVTHVP